jgi:tRNA-2-methylthio-N6-dimethylallyladenosine synthase
VKEVKQLVMNGTREITLLGQNVNAYNFEGKKLSDLILEIAKISQLQRIRYTTSHPKDFTQDLMEAHKSCVKLMPLIHLPVQSGSNRILKNMNRKHTIEEYIHLVEKLKFFNSNIKLSSDFIIGYPGETEDDFEDTLNLINKVKFINTFSFLFSSRPGTPSSHLKKIDENLAKRRLTIFQNMSKKIKTEYRQNLLNKIAPVLFENMTKKKNMYFGRDEHFNSVIVESNENLTGKIKNIEITKVSQNTLFGKISSKITHKEFAA